MLLQQVPFLSISFSTLCGAHVTRGVGPQNRSIARYMGLEMEAV
jgi:hypothetical protein